MTLMKNFPAGHPRPYVRDGVGGLSRERQKEILAAAGVPLDQLFEDKLSKAAIRRRGLLKDRDELVKPSKRTTPETIFVASFRALGWAGPEIARAIAAGFRRHASVVDVSAGRVLSVDTPPDELLAALAEIEEERVKINRDARLTAGREAAKAMRERRRASRLDRAKPLWTLPPGEMSTAEIANHVNLSPRTLYKYLGTREDARERAKKEKN